MGNKRSVTIAEANEILETKAILTIPQWQYIHESLLALQPSQYRFDETCEDLAYEFLRLAPEQFLPFVCGKFLGSIQKPIVCRLCDRLIRKT